MVYKKLRDLGVEPLFGMVGASGWFRRNNKTKLRIQPYIKYLNEIFPYSFSHISYINPYPFIHLTVVDPGEGPRWQTPPPPLSEGLGSATAWTLKKLSLLGGVHCTPLSWLGLACVASVSSRGSFRKLGQEQKNMNDGGGGGERRNLFCLRSNFRAITRMETLATQARLG